MLVRRRCPVKPEPGSKMILGASWQYTKSIGFRIYGVRQQAKRDAALQSAGETEATKAPSPLRSSKKLTLQPSNRKGLMQAGVSSNNEPLPGRGRCRRTPNGGTSKMRPDDPPY